MSCFFCTPQLHTVANYLMQKAQIIRDEFNRMTQVGERLLHISHLSMDFANTSHCSSSLGQLIVTLVDEGSREQFFDCFIQETALYIAVGHLVMRLWFLRCQRHHFIQDV